MNKGCRPQNSYNADQHPEHIQESIGIVFFNDGAPREKYRVGGVNFPYGHERTFGPHPAYQTETEDPHQNPGHFNEAYIPCNKIMCGSEKHSDKIG